MGCLMYPCSKGVTESWVAEWRSPIVQNLSSCEALRMPFQYGPCHASMIVVYPDTVRPMFRKWDQVANDLLEVLQPFQRHLALCLSSK